MVGSAVVNHLKYADDLVVLSPSSAGLQHLLNICSAYGVQHDIKYNTAKSVMKICRIKEDKCMTFPDFNLAGDVLCKEVPGLNLSKDFSVWNLHVLPMLAWVSSEYSGFLPQSKDMHVRLIGGSNLPIEVLVSMHGCLSMCGPAMDW